MKKLIIVIYLCFTAFFVHAQEDKATADFRQSSQKTTDNIVASFDKKDYKGAGDTINAWFSRYNALSERMRKDLQVFTISMNYNMACVCSRENKIEEGVNWFERSLAAGFEDYNNLKSDPDMENLRSNKRFLEDVQKLREKRDYGYIIQHSGSYNNAQASNMPVFTYQSASAPELIALKSKFNLDSVAGNGDEISRMKKLLYWVHNEVRHDGNSNNPSSKNAVDLIAVCQKEKRGLNCRMMSTILRDVYQSEGITTRIVTCLPKDSTDSDCHVITVAWSKTLNKWVWMDPTFNAYVTDAKGNLLNIEEVRQRLVSASNDLVLNNDANWNNRTKETQENYLGYYMSKNLYWLQCSSKSEWDIETHKPGMANIEYINLYPGSFNSIHKYVKSSGNSMEYATNNPDYFWQKPAVSGE
jgi:hypothetical protein